MLVVRARLALVLTAAVLVAGVAIASAPTFGQDRPNPAHAKAKDNGKAKTAVRKKPARRKPRGNPAVGLIVPYPFPPALIIRQTPEAHDEVQALHNLLRYH